VTAASARVHRGRRPPPIRQPTRRRRRWKRWRRKKMKKINRFRRYAADHTGLDAFINEF